MGDLHRANLAWAKHAAGYVLTLDEITDMLNGRDLSKEDKRKVQYVTRTGEKALKICEVRGPFGRRAISV